MRELGHETAEGVGLPQLLRLPPELLRVVGHMLASTAFGQAIVAKQCGREMGKAPRPAQSLYGIVCFAHGANSENFDIWDIPNPPCLTDVAWNQHLNPTERVRFKTVDLQGVSGITFFYSRVGRLLRVHGHTAQEPTAEGTFNQIRPEFQPDVLWIFCPVSERDTITAIRFALAGDICIGYHYPYYNDVVLCGSRPSLLVHKSDMYPLDATVGVYSRDEACRDIAPFQPLWKDVALPDRYWPERENFSAAPLAGVRRIQIFVRDSPPPPRCQGILLAYEDGAERALGECRVGVGPSTAYQNPARVCFRLAWEPRARHRHARGGPFGWYEVEAGGDARHTHAGGRERGGWACFAMVGILGFWFAHDCTAITIAGGTAIPDRGPRPRSDRYFLRSRRGRSSSV
ncbi:hypothetical protein KJ359_009109 [Pestalotiopsis sp. 9143b]|nr:hypothetical protein KJ359_009109 [Pestalotiopsis sp. 9143b]